ncbi:MAG: condensation domain-containing protein, partial [Gemmatimonadaceae bacterium]
MTVALSELLRDVAAQGVELWFEGPRLRFRAPRGALTTAQRETLSTERGAVIAHLRAAAASTVASMPLSYNQRALWFIQQEAPTSTAYHIAQIIRINDVVRVEELRSALQALSDRHAMLRTTYALSVDGQLLQHTRGAVDLAFEHREARNVDDAELHAFVYTASQVPFDLEHGPVFRATLFTRADDDHVLLLLVHHIAADGWSMVLLMEELPVLYADACGSAVDPLPRVDNSYADFVRWQDAWLQTPEADKVGAGWLHMLQAPRAQLSLPADRARPARKSFRGATHRFEFGESDTVRLRECARTHGKTLNVLLLSAWTALLARLTGTYDVIIGTPTFGRTQPAFARVVGHFVNTVPLRVQVDPTASFTSLLDRVSNTVNAALSGQDYPFQLMVQHARVERDPSRSPLFETFFNLISFDDSRWRAASEKRRADPRLKSYPLRVQEGQFDLSLHLAEHEGGLVGGILYSSDLYDAITIEQLAKHLLKLVEEVVVNPGTAIENLPPHAHRMRPDDTGSAPSASVQALLYELTQRDIRLTLDGEKLKVNAPAGALDDALKARLSAAKADVIAALRRPAALSVRLRPVPRVAPLPISYAQQRLWFLDRMQPGNSHYNISYAMRLTGHLHVEALTAAINQLPQRHEALRMRIRDIDGNPAAELMESVGSVVEFVSLDTVPPDARLAEARRLALAHAVKPYDLAVGPLVTALLLQLSADDHVLLLGMHHIASDGWSISVAAREICAEYDARVAGQPSPLPALEIQYVDFAAWQREQLNSGLLVQQLGYWRQELSGAPALLELPTDRPRPALLTYRGSRRKHNMSPDLLTAVKALSRKHDVTLYMTMLAAWQVVLHRYSGQDDIVVGSPMANRDDPALEGLIGCFVNNVVMRGRLAGNPTFAELLRRTSHTVLGAFDNRELPFDRLVEGLRPERSTGHAPIFQVLFTLHSFPIEPAQPVGIKAALLELEDDGRGTARFDITLDIDEHENGLRMMYEYSTDLFDERTIARMHGQYLELLQHAVGAAETRVSDLRMLTAEDEQQIFAEVNATTFAHDRETCLHELVTAAVARTPDAVAVQASDAILTYRQLEKRANQMAHALRARGVIDGSLVGVCLDRTSDLPVALLAVLKAGAAYVPLDPAHPAERLLYTLSDARVSCVITEARFAPLVAGKDRELLLVDADTVSITAQAIALPATNVNAHHLAYVIYTSGSTGHPKGVEVEHRNVVNFLRSMANEPGFTESDTLLAVTTPSFDIAGLELFLPLICGARVVIASRSDVLDGEALMALVDSAHATVMQATPATFRLMLDAGWSGKRDLRVFCGGEAMPRDLARELPPRTSVLWNMYGPTETTIW